MPPSNPATTLRPSTAVKPNRSALHSVGIGTPPDPETNRSGNTIFSDPGPRCTCPFEKYGLSLLRHQFSQRAEPGLVTSPPFDRAAVDGLARLPFAGCLNR